MSYAERIPSFHSKDQGWQADLTPPSLSKLTKQAVFEPVSERSGSKISIYMTPKRWGSAEDDKYPERQTGQQLSPVHTEQGLRAVSKEFPALLIPRPSSAQGMNSQQRHR